jgi:hypothetical protein
MLKLNQLKMGFMPFLILNYYSILIILNLLLISILNTI